MTARATPEDIHRWRRLAEAAQSAVRSPRTPCPALGPARKATKLRVVPDGPPTREHPFVRLAMLTDRFLAETARGREQMARELSAVADLCASSLRLDDAKPVKTSPPVEAEPEREPRKDIYG